jgi:hypothetical protein
MLAGPLLAHTEKHAHRSRKSDHAELVGEDATALSRSGDEDRGQQYRDRESEGCRGAGGHARVLQTLCEIK